MPLLETPPVLLYMVINPIFNKSTTACSLYGPLHTLDMGLSTSCQLFKSCPTHCLCLWPPEWLPGDLQGLYSPPGIPLRIPLESWSSAGLIPEFDILPDCGWNQTRMVIYLLYLVSLCWVPLDSIKILKIPWNVRWNSMGMSKFRAWSSCEIIYMWSHMEGQMWCHCHYVWLVLPRLRLRVSWSQKPSRV